MPPSPPVQQGGEGVPPQPRPPSFYRTLAIPPRGPVQLAATHPPPLRGDHKSHPARANCDRKSHCNTKKNALARRMFCPADEYVEIDWGDSGLVWGHRKTPGKEGASDDKQAHLRLLTQPPWEGWIHCQKCLKIRYGGAGARSSEKGPFWGNFCHQEGRGGGRQSPWWVRHALNMPKTGTTTVVTGYLNVLINFSCHGAVKAWPFRNFAREVLQHFSAKKGRHRGQHPWTISKPVKR